MNISKVFVFFFWAFSFINLYAQESNKKVLDEVDCVSQNYNFFIAGEYYKNQRNGLIFCPSGAPITIAVHDMQLNSPDAYISSLCDWSINGVEVVSNGSHFIELSKSQIENLTSITCSCDSKNGPDWPIELTQINSNLPAFALDQTHIKIRPTLNTSHSFDDNLIPEYMSRYSGGERLGTEWLFLEPSKTDEVEIILPENVIPQARIKTNSPNLTTNMVVPVISNHSEVIQITDNGSGDNQYELSVCDHRYSDLEIYSRPMENYDVGFLYMCETDDDILVNYGPVSSPDDICIDGGADGNIDLAYASGRLQGSNYLDYVNSIQVVKAGSQKNCQTSTIFPTNIRKCPMNIDLQQVLNDANYILNKSGVNLNLAQISQLDYSYDFQIDDYNLDASEQRSVHGSYSGGVNNPLPNNLIFVFIPAEYIESGFVGIATAPGGLGSLSIHTKATIVNRGNALAHETGHAKWNLDHPALFGVTDFNNFMWEDPSQIVDWLVRRYQWNKMHY